MASGPEPLEPIVILPEAQPRAAPDPFGRFRAELELNTPWYLAALRAVGEWTTASEVFRRRRLHYLVGGEALDLLLVFERLAAEVPDGVDRAELRKLLFTGEPPMFVSVAEFAVALGPIKYKAYLNHFYGITVEEALLHVAELELAKAHALDASALQEPYARIYHAPLEELTAAFGRYRGRRVGPKLTWTESKQFTYWLFRYRLRTQLPARMASDTKKALDLLRALRGVDPDGSPDPLRPDATDEVPQETAVPDAVIDIESGGGGLASR